MTNKIKNIFISHIHKDDAGLTDLCKLLSKKDFKVRNYSITSDKENNAKSDDYIKNQILSPRIKACSTLVVYVSKDTKESKWVDWEIDHAFKQGKTIIGVWEQGSKDCEIPESLNQYGNALVGWNVDNIVAAINGENTGFENFNGSPRATPTPIVRHPCA